MPRTASGSERRLRRRLERPDRSRESASPLRRGGCIDHAHYASPERTPVLGGISPQRFFGLDAETSHGSAWLVRKVPGQRALAGAYSNPHVQEQIAHLSRLVSRSSLEDPHLSADAWLVTRRGALEATGPGEDLATRRGGPARGRPGRRGWRGLYPERDGRRGPQTSSTRDRKACCTGSTPSASTKGGAANSMIRGDAGPRRESKSS
jgi:hypothetical protein